MAIRRITIQDIADACGLSRNTVSKVFNNRGTVQEPTRQLVLRKAMELGYYQLAHEEAVQQELHMQNIALLTRQMPVDYHFGTFMIPSFAAQLSREGYTLMMQEVSEEELRRLALPAHINPDQTAGILCIELFDRRYINWLLSLGLPLLLVDGPFNATTDAMNCDRISMENLASTMALVDHVISKGARKIGFVGDPNHCSSFHERWFGFRSALEGAGLPLNRALCILDGDESPYSDAGWLSARLLQMPQLPDALICVNDFIAIRVMTALKQLGVAIPGQVMVAGFDGTTQATVVEPALTTVQIPDIEIGRIAADMLLNRIANPGRPPISVYAKTSPIWRESTNRK
jgi:LacI family transcriptional regulator